MIRLLTLFVSSLLVPVICSITLGTDADILNTNTSVLPAENRVEGMSVISPEDLVQDINNKCRKLKHVRTIEVQNKLYEINTLQTQLERHPNYNPDVHTTDFANSIERLTLQINEKLLEFKQSVLVDWNGNSLYTRKLLEELNDLQTQLEQHSDYNPDVHTTDFAKYKKAQKHLQQEKVSSQKTTQLRQDYHCYNTSHTINKHLLYWRVVGYAIVFLIICGIIYWLYTVIKNDFFPSKK